MRASSLVKGYRERRYALFSLSGFTDRLRSHAEGACAALYTLDDIYAGRRLPRARPSPPEHCI